MKKILHVFAVLLVAVSHLSAQTKETQQVPKPDQGTKIRAVRFRLAPSIYEVYAFDPADTSGAPGVKLEVKDYLNDIGATIPLKGNGLILGTSPNRANLSTPGGTVANVKFGTAKSSVILMLLPGTGKPGDPLCRAITYDSRAAAFPMGTFQITNLSAYTVRYVLGKQTYEFKSGEVKLIKDLTFTEGASTIPMTAEVYKKDQWQRIASTTWSAPGSTREIQVIFENPKNDRVEMDGFQDNSIE